MKNLYIQTWLNIGNTKELLSETKVTDLQNYKQYQQDKTDIMLVGFQNSNTFTLVFK